MKYRRLGRSGLKVSVFSLGSWVTIGRQIDEDVARDCLLAAFEHGVNYFDGAEAYAGGRAETIMGSVFAELRREDLVLSSKVFWGGDGPNDTGLNAKHVTEACHGALERLQTDYLDLYFCHRPDPSTPIEETCRAMDRLVRQGKVLYWGTSEWTAAQLLEAFRLCDRLGLVAPTMEQPQYNMFNRRRVEVELDPLVKVYGLGLTVWSPLASGLLTGKYNDGIPEGSRAALPGMEWLLDKVILPDRIERVKELIPIAEAFGASLAELALAWAARHDNVSTVITGASSKEQVLENVKAVPVIDRLDEACLEKIDMILDNVP